MRKKPDYSLTWEVHCQHCGSVTLMTLDSQKVVADHVLRYLDQQLQEVLSKHQKDLSAAIPGRGRSDRDEAIGQLKKELAESIEQREDLHRQAVDLAARLEEKISDETSARADVGRSMHTAHRQLADEVSGLFPKIHRVARGWALASDTSRSDPRSWSVRAATVFRLLFTPNLIADSDRRHWLSLTDADAEARSLAEEAAVLARKIRELPGYQKWIWDMVPGGTAFDGKLHDPWRNCAEEGYVEFVVIPAYLVDFAVITKPQVFTNWPDPTSESR